MGFVEDSAMKWKKTRAKLITLTFVLATIFCWLVYFVDRESGNNAKSTIEKAVVINDGKVLPENEGKLVMVSGRVTADADVTVTDPDFGLTVQSPFLERYVQEYWKHTDSKDNDYWSWDRIKYRSANFYSTARIGEFELSNEHLEKLSGSIRYVKPLKDTASGKYSYVVEGSVCYYPLGNSNIFTQSTETTNKRDARVRYSMVDLSVPVEHTILAKQEGGKLTVYSTGKSIDDDINNVYEGRKSISEILSEVEAGSKENNTYLIIFPIVFSVITVFRFWRKKRRSRR